MLEFCLKMFELWVVNWCFCSLEGDYIYSKSPSWCRMYLRHLFLSRLSSGKSGTWLYTTGAGHSDLPARKRGFGFVGCGFQVATSKVVCQEWLRKWRAKHLGVSAVDLVIRLRFGCVGFQGRCAIFCSFFCWVGILPTETYLHQSTFQKRKIFQSENSGARISSFTGCKWALQPLTKTSISHLERSNWWYKF